MNINELPFQLGEEWVPVKGHHSFFISSLGRCFSEPRKGTKGGLLKVRQGNRDPDSRCYPAYHIGNTYLPIHRLLALHFIPNPDNHPFVLHKDDDLHNYNLDNLYWGNDSLNSFDRWNNGGRKRTVKKFTTDEGEEVVVEDLRKWCNERRLPFKRVETAIYRGKVVNTKPYSMDKWGNRK